MLVASPWVLDLHTVSVFKDLNNLSVTVSNQHA